MLILFDGVSRKYANHAIKLLTQILSYVEIRECHSDDYVLFFTLDSLSCEQINKLLASERSEKKPAKDLKKKQQKKEKNKINKHTHTTVTRHVTHFFLFASF